MYIMFNLSYIAPYAYVQSVDLHYAKVIFGKIFLQMKIY
jgi:hypothetical protein